MASSKFNMCIIISTCNMYVHIYIYKQMALHSFVTASWRNSQLLWPVFWPEQHCTLQAQTSTRAGWSRAGELERGEQAFRLFAWSQANGTAFFCHRFLKEFSAAVACVLAWAALYFASSPPVAPSSSLSCAWKHWYQTPVGTPVCRYRTAVRRIRGNAADKVRGVQNLLQVDLANLGRHPSATSTNQFCVFCMQKKEGNPKQSVGAKAEMDIVLAKSSCPKSKSKQLKIQSPKSVTWPTLKIQMIQKAIKADMAIPLPKIILLGKWKTSLSRDASGSLTAPAENTHVRSTASL